MSTVSVVIPCYNYARFIPACLGSVLTQGDVDVEVLLIDDCSNDWTPIVGAAAARADARITFRRHETNAGHLATYNEGLAWASGDYTVLLSVDDLLVPGALGRAAGVLDSHPEVGMVYGRSLYFQSEDDLPPARTGEALPQRWRGRDWIAQRCRTATNCISSPEVVVRTELQQRLGGYRADLPHAGDLEMWLRFAASADIAFLRGVDQAYYRVHPDSMLRTKWTSPIADLRQRKSTFDALFAGQGQNLEGAEDLHTIANRALAREALWTACRAFDRSSLEASAREELEAFAFEAYPDAGNLREHTALRLRQRAGPRLCRVLQPLSPGAATRRVRNKLRWRHWRKYGV